MTPAENVSPFGCSSGRRERRAKHGALGALRQILRPPLGPPSSSPAEAAQGRFALWGLLGPQPRPNGMEDRFPSLAAMLFG
eukprot:2545590-Alexandrium_andersonii.AAC.1